MNAAQHEPDCRGFYDHRGRDAGVCLDWCWGCHRCEPQREGDFRVCGECLHVYRTTQELVARHNGVIGDLRESYDGHPWPPPSYLTVEQVDRVNCCPICAHDF